MRNAHVIDRHPAEDGSIDILIAEDSTTQAMSLQFLLEKEGYRVTVCENGRVALDTALRRKPTLVISDIVMPLMNGYDLCRAFKAHSGLADVPVLLVTTLNDPEDVLRGLEAGADSFILKPYDDPFLLNRIRFVLLHRQLRQTDRSDMGVEITFKGRSHFITSDRLQILNLLLSTYEAAIQRNEELRRSEEELRNTNDALSDANARLQQEILQREAAEAQVRQLSQELLEASQERLERTEERYRQLLDVVPVAIYATDSQGRIQEYNQAAADLWGKSPWTGVDGEAFYRDYAIVDDAGTSSDPVDARRLLSNGGVAKNATLALARPDGVKLDLLVNTAPIPERHGMAQGAIHSLLDVSELTRAHRELETSRQLVQATLDALPVYVGVLDASGTVIAANRAWQGYLDAHPALAACSRVGACYLDRWKRAVACEPNAARRFDEQIRELMAGRQNSLAIEYCNIEEGRWFDISATRFAIGDTVRFVLVYQEITQRKQAQDKLKESMALLRIAGEAARIGGWAYDVPEQQLIWSDEVAEIHGLPAGTSPDLDMALEFYAPQSRELIEEHFRRCVQDGEPFDDEAQIVTASGERLWVRAIGGAVREGGAVVRVQGALQDISRRKEEEGRVARIAERLATTLESITDGFFTVDREWRFTYVNGEAERILHRPRGELLGRRLWDIFPDAIGTEFEHSYRRAMEHGTSQHFEAYYPPLNLWVEVHAYPSEEGLGVYFRDVTQRKQAELALRQSEENLRLAVTAGGLGTWRWDIGDDSIVVPSEANAGFPLARSGRIAVEDFFAAIHPDDRHRVRSVVDRAMEARATFDVDYRLSLPGGEVRWLASLGRAYVDEESGGVRMEGVNIDITERKRTEQQLLELNEQLEHRVIERTQELALAKQQAEAANEAKSAFLATMSHEIRTPMNGIVGMVDVLSHGDLNDHQNDAVKTIRDSAFGLLQLIDDILDFSKIEAGKIELESVEVSLSEIAERICDTLSPLADATNVDIFLYVDPDGPPRVRTDPVRLRQILFNLLGNAVKFSGGRGERGRVELRVEMAQPEPMRVRLVVRDNGIGMSQEVQSHLFESFRQGEVSTTRRFGGSGLGLAICRRLVDLMGGTIGVESREGEGSVFTVELPVRAGGEGEGRPLANLEGATYALIRGAMYNAEDFQSYLRAAGAQALIVESATDAARAVGEHAVLIQDDPGPRLRNERLAGSSFSGHLLVGRGRRRTARVVADDVVVIDGNSLRRSALLHAAAVAAGLASPETPRLRAPDSLRIQVPAASVAEARHRGQLILIAEDDPTNQKVLLRQLELLGYTAEVASDGQEALRLWRKGGYALLLTDLHMPQLDGYGLTSAIRREEPSDTHLPILALTANALRGEALKAKANGFDEYLTKPVQLDVLRELLAKWLPPSDGRDTAGANAEVPGDRRRADATLDLSVLVNLVGDDPDVLRELLVEYERSAKDARLELAADFSARNFDHMGAIAHRLKSSSRAVGALALGDLCAELENASKLGDREAVARTASSLLPAIDEVLEQVALAARQDLGVTGQ